MPQALTEQRPDIVKGWLQAELDAQLYFADGKNSVDVSKMAAEQTTGFTQKELWFSAYGTYPAKEGGTATRIVLPYGFSPDSKSLIEKAAKFLLEIKSIKEDIRPEAVMPNFTADILKERNLAIPVGEVKAQPDSAYTGP
jgi:NitT/TauT family transport system substrate-binding protein